LFASLLGSGTTSPTDSWTAAATSNLLISTEFTFGVYRRFCGCWDFTILGRWGNTSARLFVENKSGWATLETWVSSLAGPVSFTRGTKWYIGIRVFSTERVLLAACNIGWPITSMSFFVVEKSTNTELFSCGSVPASPVASAGSFMAKDTIQPVAVFSGDGGVCKLLIVTIPPTPWVVASFSNTTVTAYKDQTVGAIIVLWNSSDTFPVSVAVCDISNHSVFMVTRIRLLELLG